MKGVKASVEIIEGSTNRFCFARSVPLAMEERVSIEIYELVEKGILSPVPPGGVLNASPLVWIKKKDGRLGMCVDYKLHINGKICSEAYPLPNMETMFAKMNGARYFAKIDLKSAYWQIELDDAARKLCAVNTSKGVYLVNRLQMGMKNRAAIFQQVMETHILKGLKNIIVYQDDILIYGTTAENLCKCLNAVLGRLREKNVTINEAKCISKSQNMDFLGRTLTPDGIKPDK
jgi:hypothetical protein